MKLWIDDVRPAPDGYVWCKSVDDAIYEIDGCNLYNWVSTPDDKIEIISLDHDAGNFAKYGGDYIQVLDYLEYLEKTSDFKVDFSINLHSMNPVGVENMRRIIRRNGWKEI